MDVFDFDGDGKLDIIGVLNNDGRFGILPGNGDGTFGQARVFDAGRGAANRFSRNDIDGDGRTDLAIPNTSANTVTILLQVSAPPTLGVVTEFYNTILDNYFITADPNEAAAIDNGSAGPGWMRTGSDFNFNSGGNTYVCRFYGSITPGPNSHFYTVSSSECNGLKAMQATTPPTEKRWNFESLDFVSTVPAIWHVSDRDSARLSRLQQRLHPRRRQQPPDHGQPGGHCRGGRAGLDQRRRRDVRAGLSASPGRR